MDRSSGGPTKMASFTPRELEVLQLIIAGKTNREVAKQLCVCDKTVEFHLANVYLKMGVRTRTEAVVWALRQRITPASGL